MSNPKDKPPTPLDVLMHEAIVSSGANCTDEVCQHSDAIQANLQEALADATAAAQHALINGLNPILGVLAEGIHVGYRLAQLQFGKATPAEPPATPKEQVN